jgi:hypothetical protein
MASIGTLPAKPATTGREMNRNPMQGPQATVLRID